MRTITTLINSTLLSACLWTASSAGAATMVTTNVVGGNTGWNTTGIWKTNGVGTAVTGVVPGNTYECAFNGVAFGNSTANTRMRNLYATTSPLFQTFPGDSLTLHTNTEFRFKRIDANNIPTVNFPGVGGNPGLILNGGVLNVGDDMVMPIDGKIYAVPGTVSFICPGDNGLGSTARNNRTFNILGELSGSGTLYLLQSPAVNPHLISGNSNTFSGQWTIRAGWLRGVGTNSLGTGNIVVDPYAEVPLDPNVVATTTIFNGPAILEPMYDLNSPGTLTLANGGQMRLHQNCAFTAVTIDGMPLSSGTHYYAELAATYPANFPAGGSGAITVKPYGQLPVIFIQQPLPQMVYQGKTARFSAVASGPGTISYQWRKGGVNLSDGGNISGANTPSLTISNVSTLDGGNYDVVVSNGVDSNTSRAVPLTVVIPSGEAYEAAVLAASPAVFYRLNEMGDPLTNAYAFDFIGGGLGNYGAATLNGFNAIAGPTSASGFPGFAAGNKAVQGSAYVAGSRVTVAPWNLNTNTVTITAWVNPSTVQAPSVGLVFCRGSGTVAGLNFSSGVDALGNRTLGYTWNNEWETYSWDSGIAPPSGQWSFVALVVSPTSATLHLMNANGLLESTRTYAHVPQSFAGTTLIGDDPAAGDGSRSFAGVIDDVAVFPTSLSKAQLVALYSAALGSAANYAPVISLQPASQFLYAGQTATFRVAGGGTEPLTYQWKKGAVGSGVYANLTDGGNVSGATTATLVISNISAADQMDYVVTLANSLGSVTSTPPATLTVLPTSPAEEILMAGVLQPAGSDWNTPGHWSDGLPAADSAAMKPGSTYRLVPSGGLNTRLRTPEAPRTAIFPGSVLTLDGTGVFTNNFGTNGAYTEIRFKQPNPGRVIFPKLVMNGGQLDSGNDGIIEIGGWIEVRTNTPIYNDSGNDRGYLISARLTGGGTIEYYGYSQTAFRSNYVNNLNIACPTNTFTGKWNVVMGTLLGTAPNALGTNDITVGTNGALQTTYDINSPDAMLVLNGRMYLHQNHTFKSVIVNGVPLAVGTHTFAQLNAAYPAQFPASWMPQVGATNYTSGSGSITVLVQPAPTIVQQPVSLSKYPTETAQFTVLAQGNQPLFYRWRKGGLPLTDGGNLSGATTASLSISNIVPADAGSYDVVITNAIGSVTSLVATLTVLPTGPALNLTLDYGGAPVVQPTGADWDTPNSWSDGNPASLSALANPGSTYTVVPGARLRTPNGATNAVFPGDVLTVAGDGVFAENGANIGEIRFKHTSPGVVYFKRLVMNGGQLDSGNNDVCVIQGRMDVLANTPIYADSGAGQDRGWRIEAWLTGNGSIEFRNATANFTANLDIAGTSNTFSGTWNVVRGVLLGSAPGSLGTNHINVGATGALETLYDINNPHASLTLDGQLFLHQNHTFKAVTVAGTPLAPGTYSFAQLNSAYPANFPASWPMQVGSAFSTGSGSVTVLGEAPPQVPLGFSFAGGNLTLTWSQGTLLEATNVTGPWVTNNAPSPFTVTPTELRKFYRVQVR